MSQSRFAFALGVTAQSVQNWEAGRRKPAPEHLEKMMKLAPALLLEIANVIQYYRWHGRPADSEEMDLPADLVFSLRQMASAHGLDFTQMLAKVVRTGLAQLSLAGGPAASSTKSLVARTAEASRRVGHGKQPRKQRDRAAFGE
jgi:transcriptional regulator with XRE-family HTH domain